MILIRHGQSEFNVVYSVSRTDPGIRDPKLTAEGRRQAQAAAEALRGRPLSRLVASPYTRALETAEIIAGALGLPIVVDARVGERVAFTCDIGSPRHELAQRWPHLSLDHLPDPWWPEREESEAALGHRCETFRREIAALDDWPEVAVVSHWGFIRALTGLTLPNCGVVRFDPTEPGRGAVPLHPLPA
jgi:broad specificity phosphatase PhoE